MDRAAEKHCRCCYGCQLMAKPDPPEPLKSSSLPDGPWRDLAADLLGPFPSGHSILVVVDYYSRYYEYAILQSTVTERVTDAIEGMFCRHGLPVTIKTDNGPQFISQEFKAFCEHNGIKHVRTTPKWAQANGEVERQNRSLMKRIKIAQAEGTNWKRELQRYVFKYRSTEHATTGKSPAELLFNRKIRGKLPDMNYYDHYDQDTRDRDAEQKGKAKTYADVQRKAEPSGIKVGDQVLVKQENMNKFSTYYKPTPHVVVEKNGSKVTAQSPQGNQIVRNSTHFRRYETGDDGDTTQGENNPTEPSEPEGPILETPTEVTDGGCSETPQRSRPQRERRLPEKFKDFVMD